MYQSFTGASRRPRQVNLSGKNANPFAAAGTSSSGAQGAIQSAQQERQRRERQRLELSAAITIQRVWRGHSIRRETLDTWRQQWDAQDASASDPARRLNMLMLFFSPSNDGDVQRLVTFVSTQSLNPQATQATQAIQTTQTTQATQAYLRLEKACLAVLGSAKASQADKLLPVLASLATAIPQQTSSMSVQYYRTLSNLDQHPGLLGALVAPLSSRLLPIYEGLVAAYLTVPHETALLDRLSSALDTSLLTQAVSNVSSNASLDFRNRLWLMGQFVYLIHGALHVSDNVPIVARLLSSLTEDVSPEDDPLNMDNLTYDRLVLSKRSSRMKLNKFLHYQFHCLVDQDAIRSLVTRPRSSSTTNIMDDTSDTAQLLASYALTLLRLFPGRADDIRMWLYLGPSWQDSTEETVPAIAYFWKGVRTTNIFNSVTGDPRAAIELLKAPKSSVSSWQPPGSSGDQTTKLASEWRVILIFLELFTFVLKIMDDEEFLGVTSGAGSKMSNNALPISDIKDLTIFLKELGFAMYYHFQEISDSYKQSSDTLSPVNLSRYFGNITNTIESKPAADPQHVSVAGTSGIRLDHLKGLVTGLLRSIYERDSRRKFLPQGHWLMTDRFDMTNLIAQVVAEHQNREQLRKQADEDGDLEDSDSESELMSSQPGNNTRSRRSSQPSDRAQRNMSKKRHLEVVAPRLEVLENMPYIIPFEIRVKVFRHFVHLDQVARRNGHVEADMWRHSVMFSGNGQNELMRHHAKIRRKNEFEDAFDQFYDIGVGLKEPIQITFLDEFGLVEAGIDGGGVTKEFLTSVTSEALDPSKGFFQENSQHLLYPNPTSFEAHREELRLMGYSDNDATHHSELTDLLKRYEFLGRVVGKCLYEGILIDISFAGFFLLKWALFGTDQGYKGTINDIRELDEELYQGLLKLKYHPGNVEDWDTYFVINDTIPLPDGTYKTVERDLVPNGSNQLVTNENRLVYISRVARWRLDGQASPQTTAFLNGLGSIIQNEWLKMFNQSELQTLIGGAASSISISDLRQNTAYGGVYVIGDDGQEHPSVRLFWDVMETLPDSEQRKVLKFVTSTPRAPLLGFGSLNPRFSIRDSGDDEARFPTTSTCVNLLKLPRYRNRQTLREKLLYAVNSGAGFDLS